MSLNICQPFTAAEAARAGIPRAELISRKYRRLHWGCYVAAQVHPTVSVMALAAMKVVPAGQFVSHHTAAKLHQLPVPDTSFVHLGTTRDRATRRRLVRLHRYSSAPETLQLADGVLTTSPRQTYLDLSTELGLVETVVLGDCLLRQARRDAAWLLRWIREREGGATKVARYATDLLSPLAESPQESRTRMFLHLCGLPPVDEQIVVQTASGERRLDAGWAAYRLAIEYDGRQHIKREGQWTADNARREDLQSVGWRLITVTSDDLYVTPQRTVDRIARIMVECGMPQPRLRDDWRHYFPGRGNVA